jgi:hypothetical protein
MVLLRRRRMAQPQPSATPDPDSPPSQTSNQNADAAKARASDSAPPRPCSVPSATASEGPSTLTPPIGPADRAPNRKRPCPPAQNPYQRFLNSTAPIPLTPRQKGHLALHNFIDPGNLVTVLGTSGIAIASDSHTAYGPGWRGFGKNAGISFVQDATGDFFGTFLVPSIAHEDPHYHRLPNASVPMRALHAISRTVIAQSDDGRPMLNYATLLTYPITAEIANLYVPGVATNGPSTVKRVLTGYATDPVDNLITEFLPDLAKHVHVRVIFVQQIINQVAAGQPVNMFP